jgi:hypothetical protein
MAPYFRISCDSLAEQPQERSGQASGGSVAGRARLRAGRRTAFLWEEEGILGIGRAGEEVFGRRHFKELFTVFLAPPLFTVLHGRQELGFVDELTFLSKQEAPQTLLLGGRAWRVTHIDWQRRVAHVEPSEDKGRSRWKGTGQVLGFRLCQSIKGVLASDESRPCWSQRAQDHIRQLRDDFSWVTPEGSSVIANKSGEIAVGDVPTLCPTRGAMCAVVDCARDVMVVDGYRGRAPGPRR